MPGLWVTSGPGLPCGARKMAEDVLGPAPDGRVWLDVCILGQHLPQMYQEKELNELTADGCARLGLCPDCLGFGDTSPVNLGAGEALMAARGIDEVKRPCLNCAGSGRPALRITVTRDGSGTQGAIRPLPHVYVAPLDGKLDPLMALAFEASPEMCLACGMPPDGTGPRGEALHK